MASTKTRTVEPEQRRPSNRRRFVRRAETLKHDKGYRKRTDQIRSEWNEQFPAFRLGERMRLSRAEDGLVGTRMGLKFPVLLDAAMEYERWTSVGVTFAAFDRWRQTVNDHAEHYWPADDFPHPPVFHPAILFVSLCLIYDVDTVPPSSIHPYDHGPQWAPSNPKDGTSTREYRSLQASLGVLRGRASRCRRRDGPHSG